MFFYVSIWIEWNPWSGILLRLASSIVNGFTSTLLILKLQTNNISEGCIDSDSDSDMDLPSAQSILKPNIITQKLEEFFQIAAMIDGLKQDNLDAE